MKYQKKIFLILLLLPLSLYSKDYVVEQNITWNKNKTTKINDLSAINFFSFENSQYDEKMDFLPFYSHLLTINQEEINNVEVLEIKYETFPSEEVAGVSGVSYIKDDIQLSFSTYTSRKVNYGVIKFYPIIRVGGSYKKVISFKIKVTTSSSRFKVSKNNSFNSNSVLSSGDWYKFAVLNEGVYKIDYNLLKQMGIDVDNVNPNDFKLYGNGGKMLPALNSDFRPDDLVQNAVEVVGAIDNSFDPQDYVLFYGQSPHTWTYNQSTGKFEHFNHQFSDSTFYFITFSNTSESPKRISVQASMSSPNLNVTSFNDYDFYEKDLVNLIKSGAVWLGDIFNATTSYNYVFNFPNVDVSAPASVDLSVVGRSGASNSFVANVSSSSINLTCNAVNMSSYTGKFGWPTSGTLNFTPSSSIVNMQLTYNKPTSESIGWLDEIEVNVRRNLVMTGDQMFYRDVQSVGVGNVSTFNLSNALGVNKVWDISDPNNIFEQSYVLTGSNLSYNIATDTLKSFVAFNGNYKTDIYSLGKVENQNLHGIQSADMIIVSHPEFLSQSSQLASFHNNEGLDVVIVTPQQIYNEFSSGSQDIVAIRDFVRMLYDRAVSPQNAPKYLLLFGDGSYDNKNRIVGNTNFIPTYQTDNSLDVIGSLVSDDYYGLLDLNEGTWAGTEFVDIGIGRLPVKNQEEANNVVNKILNYNTTSTMKDWRNRITYIGDDEDNNTHMIQSNSLAGITENNDKEYNPDKVFFDAFQQVSTPGGSRYPDVNKKINESVNEGALIVNYTGHGGEAGWGHERVLTISDIENWENSNLPLFVTATCEFSRFDDPLRTSAGELVLLKPHGGIGLLTTVRLVFSSPNFVLNQTFFNQVFQQNNGEYATIGEIFMNVKNLNASVANNRNFTLLGDPAIRLAYPKHEVITTMIDSNVVSASDTLKALQKVTVFGEVRDENGQKLNSFNGVIYPTVFDKFKSITTLGNDGNVPLNFDLQTSKLFKGKVSVTNGDFSYTFVVPKDIAYNYGQGKFSYYAENQEEDANGYHSNFYIGGTSDSYAEDNTGPEIELFMNDENFVFGGMTDENPILLANIYDLHGINMVGNGIGHDIVAILDEETDNSFVLNDYYEADLNSYQRGKVYFPFEDLEEGRHTLTVKVWDVYNNSSEAKIEFVVVKSKDLVLDKVYNYPNPFTTYTEFWFEHNQPGKSMYAQVQVFTVSGKLVKTLEKHILNEGYHSTSITWDGLDEYGDKIGRGVYIYRLKVRAENYSVAEKYEKLVILR
ncbi:MAG: type IX secretion system sortase PorU [Vicingaceae bacterium]|nr:type IX secretion system sortase PorU [Vicingaceae bacterium]